VTLVHLIRHGQTAHNRDGLGLGLTDVPLTPLGERQAAALGAAFAARPIGRLLCSPLARARQTAAAVAGDRDVPIEVREELTEMNVGETEGLTFAEMNVRFPEFLARWRSADPADVHMPGGESLRGVAARLQPIAAEVRAADADLAIVSHNFVLKLLLCDLLELRIDQFRLFTTDLTSLTTIAVDHGRGTIRTLNDCCHLRSLEP
jgi:broad specificity phosphatase PhoE